MSFWIMTSLYETPTARVARSPMGGKILPKSLPNPVLHNEPTTALTFDPVSCFFILFVYQKVEKSSIMIRTWRPLLFLFLFFLIDAV